MSDSRTVNLEWTGAGLEFRGEGTDPDTPAIVIDADATAGPSPMLTLLLACAGCSASDVVLILEKMRVPLRMLSLTVTGERRAEPPRRYIAIRFLYRMSGEGLDQAKAERAVSLSLEKYCSVVHSLAPDIDVEHEIELV